MTISPAISHSFKWGSITGTAVLASQLLSYYFSGGTGAFSGFLPVLLTAVGMFVAAITYRNKHKGGFAKYGIMLGQTLGVGVMSALFHLVFILLLIYRLDPIFIDKYLEIYKESISSVSGVPALYSTPEFAALQRAWFVPMMFFSQLLSNVFYALLIAFAAYRKPLRPSNTTHSQNEQ